MLVYLLKFMLISWCGFWFVRFWLSVAKNWNRGKGLPRPTPQTCLETLYALIIIGSVFALWLFLALSGAR